MIDLQKPKAPANEYGERIVLRADLYKYATPRKIENQAGGEYVEVYYPGDDFNGEPV